MPVPPTARAAARSAILGTVNFLMTQTFQMTSVGRHAALSTNPDMILWLASAMLFLLRLVRDCALLHAIAPVEDAEAQQAAARNVESRGLKSVSSRVGHDWRDRNVRAHSHIHRWIGGGAEGRRSRS